MKLHKYIAIILTIIFIGGCTLNILIYLPKKEDYYYLQDGLFTVRTEDNETIYGYFSPAPPNSPFSNITILFFHGNAISMNTMADTAMLFHDIGVNFIMFDYRGYGKSTGTPSEEGTYKDAEAIIKYVLSLTNIDTNNIFFLGHSLGTAIATEMTLKYKPKALILAAGFTSIDDMTDYYTTYSFPSSWFVEYKYDTISKIPNVSVPILFIHGTADEVVPYWMSISNYSRAKEPKKLVLIPNIRHERAYLFTTQEFRNEITNFINTYRN